MTPFFSVVIPLYNKASFIKSTIDSVLNQSFGNFELIIVNDGSTDNSLTKINSIEDQRVRVISQENKGVSSARNLGIKSAKSNLIAFLDADDIWKPYHLDDLKTLFKKYPNCGLYCKAYHRTIDGIRVNCSYNTLPKNKNWSGILEDFFTASMHDNICTSSSVLVPKRIFESVGYFNESYNSGEDTDLWIRIALSNSVAFYNKDSVSIHWNSSKTLLKRTINPDKFMDLDAYIKEERNSDSLKKYLDKNRASLALQQKMVGNFELVKYYLNSIDSKNLGIKTKMVLNLPRFALRLLFDTRNLLRRFINIDLRLFR